MTCKTPPAWVARGLSPPWPMAGLVAAEELLSSARSAERGLGVDARPGEVEHALRAYDAAIEGLQGLVASARDDHGVVQQAQDHMRVAHANRAMLRIRSGDKKGAEEDGRAAKALEAVASAAPKARRDSAEARRRGDDAYARRDWTAAIEHFTECLALVPDQPDVLAQRGMARLMAGDVDGAAADDAAANGAFDKQKPEQVAEILRRARMEKDQGGALFKQGHVPQALECYSRALALTPDDATLRANRALCHLKLGNASLALTDADAAIAAEPDHAKAHYRRAKALQALSRLDDARKAMDDVCRLLPNAKDMRAERDAIAASAAKSNGDSHVG